MTLEPFIVLLSFLFFAHWVGDFVLQSDSMALNKSHSNEALTRHVVAYSAPIVVWMVAVLCYVTPTQSFWWFYPVTVAAHWITDWCTSRWTARLYHTNRRNFFVVIGLDQLLHHLTLIATFYFLILS